MKPIVAVLIAVSAVCVTTAAFLNDYAKLGFSIAAVIAAMAALIVALKTRRS
ncbi:MAG: hypothetical protein IJU16_07770 [Clostridia bacterium]|nr:hypothetical protein [Clostridia bacterium]